LQFIPETLMFAIFITIHNAGIHRKIAYGGGIY